MQSKEKLKKILPILKKSYPKAKTALKHKSALQLLIATILSAQSTDKKINEITPKLFQKYKTAKDFANAPITQLQNLVKASGFYRQKAKNIKNACKIIQEKGRVPNTMEELIKLPGVARKTANIVLSTWYKKNEGIAVDTHVQRVSQRLKLTKNKDPKKIEQDLMKIIPKKDWGNITNLLISHGRKICTAKKPKITECPLKQQCCKIRK